MQPTRRYMSDAERQKHEAILFEIADIMTEGWFKRNMATSNDIATLLTVPNVSLDRGVLRRSVQKDKIKDMVKVLNLMEMGGKIIQYNQETLVIKGDSDGDTRSIFFRPWALHYQ